MLRVARREEAQRGLGGEVQGGGEVRAAAGIAQALRRALAAALQLDDPGCRRVNKRSARDRLGRCRRHHAGGLLQVKPTGAAVHASRERVAPRVQQGQGHRSRTAETEEADCAAGGGARPQTDHVGDGKDDGGGGAVGREGDVGAVLLDGEDTLDTPPGRVKQAGTRERTRERGGNERGNNERAGRGVDIIVS